SHHEHHLQLLQAGLFPASTTRPRTAFTFEVLDHFLIDALECKTSAMSFFEKIRRLTNNAFPDTVPDRYRELMRVSRLWRDLKNRKWFGFGHDKEAPLVQEILPYFALHVHSPESICLLFGSNSMKGKSIPKSLPARLRPVPAVHSIAVVLADNMCPGQWLVMKRLGGYMVTDREYQAHLTLAIESKEVTQIVLYYYSICNAIKHAAGNIDNSLIIYDVGCQWNLNFGQRVANCPGLALPDNTKIVAAVGKFHLSAHKLACFARYSLNFIQGAGQVDGEILETLWAPFNKISPTARSMSQAHRQEILDDHMRNSNWRKLVRIVKTLLRKYKRANKGIEDTRLPFEELTGSLDVIKVRAWEKDEEKAKDERGEHLDIYQLKIDKGKLGSISWLIDGINIEDSQDALRVAIRQLPKDASAVQRAALQEKRQKLAARISKFHEIADAMTEGIEVHADAVEEVWEAADIEDVLEEMDEAVPAEVMAIWMPSSVSRNEALALGLHTLQAEELELRKGQANDCLEKLRQALGHKAIIYRQHFRSADSTWTGTRSKQEALQCHIKIEKCVRRYQRARSSIQRLGADEDTLTTIYQDIQLHQLSVDKEVTEENRYGQGSDRLAWFWRVNNGHDLKEDVWMDEFYRVNWLKAKARWQRWEEELRLVQHEMGWTVCVYQKSHQLDMQKSMFNIYLSLDVIRPTLLSLSEVSAGLAIHDLVMIRPTLLSMSKGSAGLPVHSLDLIWPTLLSLSEVSAGQAIHDLVLIRPTLLSTSEVSACLPVHSLDLIQPTLLSLSEVSAGQAIHDLVLIRPTLLSTSEMSACLPVHSLDLIRPTLLSLPEVSAGQAIHSLDLIRPTLLSISEVSAGQAIHSLDLIRPTLLSMPSGNLHFPYHS
ncbi:uncharacterized protein F5147DRAFT_799314, partial [Suillus discolor]